MSKRQVQFLLGTPLLTDPFHSNRWDYVYSLQKDGELVQERHLSLFFEGELLNRIEGSDELLN
jgi:outer membrane protein assembly factor BamE